MTPLSLPGAKGLIALDYFAFDSANNRLWAPAGNTHGCRSGPDGDGARSVASGRLVGGVKSFQEGDKSRGFGRAEIFAVGRHVATALNDLANELVLCEEKSDFVESGAALAALVPE